MADKTSLQNDFDEIATALEKSGRADLAGIVDLCAYEIQNRKATTVKKARAARPGTGSTVSAKSAAGDTLKKIRWARAELKDLSREFRKIGSIAEARNLLRLAEDLAEDEAEFQTGDIAEGGEAIEGGDFEIDLDTPIEDEIVDGDDVDAADVDECVCDDVAEDDVAEDDVAEEAEEVVEAVEAEEAVAAEGDEPELQTVEACAKELRAISREFRKMSDLKSAAFYTRLACECERAVSETSDLGTVPMPPASAEPPIDASDFDVAHNDEILDFTADENSPDAPAPAGPSTPEEFEKAASILKRTASKLSNNGYKAEAVKLQRKAATFRAAAARMKK